MLRALLVVSETDPVARAVLGTWGPLTSTGEFVDGAAIRSLTPEIGVLHRPGPHIHDELLDQRLPPGLREQGPTLVFPSIHRSERGDCCFTVHPLGNSGSSAEVGGSPRTLVPSDPLLMTGTLRRLAEDAPRAGLPASFEATHHGPQLGLPAFFAEIGYGADAEPSVEAVRVLSGALREMEPSGGDRITLGVGGGHYAPHFTDLAVKRRWAFGHLISRHALEGMDPATAEQARRCSPGAEGALFARAADAQGPLGKFFGPRLGEGAAPRRVAAPERID